MSRTFCFLKFGREVAVESWEQTVRHFSLGCDAQHVPEIRDKSRAVPFEVDAWWDFFRTLRARIFDCAWKRVVLDSVRLKSCVLSASKLVCSLNFFGFSKSTRFTRNRSKREGTCFSLGLFFPRSILLVLFEWTVLDRVLDMFWEAPPKSGFSPKRSPEAKLARNGSNGPF